MYNLVEHSKTGNGQAVSTRLEDERFEVSIYCLEKSLRNGFTAVVELLIQDDRV